MITVKSQLKASLLAKQRKMQSDSLTPSPSSTPPSIPNGGNKSEINNKEKSSKKRSLDSKVSDTTSTKKRQKVRIATDDGANAANSGSTLPADNLNDNEENTEVVKKMYKVYLKNAFDSLDKKNNSTPIETLSAKISLPRSSRECLPYSTISTILQLLSNEVSRLDNKQCNSLILSLLNIPNWAKQDTKFINNYITFLMVLTSGLPRWHNEIVSLLIKDLTRFAAPSSKSSDDTNNGMNGSRVSISIKAPPINTKSHHEYFKYLIRIIPTSLNFFLKTLLRNFPDKYCEKYEAVNYVQNLFEVVKYAPEIRFQLLSCIVEFCIKLDVELKSSLDEADDDLDEDIDVDDEEEEDDDNEDDEDDDGEDADESMKQAEDDDDNSDNEGYEDEEEAYGVDLTVNINELSNKLDSVMERVFVNLGNSFTVANLNTGDGIILFRSLISIFKSYILSTSNTRSVQFLIFHFSQQQPELIDAFLVTLIDITFNVNETLEQRIKAVQYLSSYLSRAKKVLRHQLIFVTSYLISWINRYVNERECEVGDGNGGMERFKLFYAVFQCLLYIFCFRHEELKKSSNIAATANVADAKSTGFAGSSEWECSIDKFFQKLILTKFNPLKFCNETVVLMFAKIAHQENVAYCFSIIEHNRRDQFNSHKKSQALLSSMANAAPVPPSTNSGKSFVNDSRILFFSKQEFLDLVAYFPFDPIILKKCRSIIRDNYIEWSSLHNDYDSDSNSDDYDDGASYAREFVRRQSMGGNANSNYEVGSWRESNKDGSGSGAGNNDGYDSEVFDSD